MNITSKDPVAKKRLLVFISFSFSIRYIVRTGLLKKLSLFCEPVVAITWNQPDLISELKGKGFEVIVLPESARDSEYISTRSEIDFWFKYFRSPRNYTKIEESYLSQYKNYKSALKKKFKGYIQLSKFFIPGYSRRLLKKEQKLLRTKTNFKQIEQIINRLNVDAAFTVTPFHWQEDIALRVCKENGKKMITAILSFDNITKRGWIPVEYDLYMLWNKENKQQLNRLYPFTQNKTVHITGAPQFDFYFNKKYLLDKDEWQNIVGIANGQQKIILYAGGPQSLFPDEPEILKQIDLAITSGVIKENPLVLFRCHPIDKIERWKEHLHSATNIIFDQSWTGVKKMGQTNITTSDIQKLCSTLAYTDVHINICSTMTVDGSAFYKPQIAPAYQPLHKKNSHLLRKMYWQQHFAPIMKTGGVQLAETPEALFTFINNSLHEPQKYIQASWNIIKEVITYDDGKCTGRVATAIEKFLYNDL